MKNVLVLLFSVAVLTGCGAWDRTVAKVTGVAESCHDGVVYLQFASGATVKYTREGKLQNCN